MSVATLDRGTILKARTAVYAVFGASGLAFSALASRLPDVKRILDLSPGELGTLLLATALGSVIGLPMAGRVIRAVGTRKAVAAGVITSAVGVVITALGIDFLHLVPVVFTGMFILGLGFGIWDVAMNHEGAEVERGLGRTIMPWFHAVFSGATVASALLGSLLTWLGVPIWIHLLAVLVVAVAGALWGVANFLPIDEELAEAAKASGRSAWTEPRTLIIGLVVLATAFTEGAANDWIAVAMTDGYELPAWLGVLGFATFLGFMTIGRIAGSYALDRFGRVPVLRALFSVAIVGSLLVVFGGPTLAFLGAAMWGLGASLGFPVGMSAAADDPVRAPARLSVISTIGYLAFLGGPPLLGYLGDHVGVLLAMLAVAAFLVPALLAVPAVREEGRAAADGSDPA